jgi:lipopolysaccharide transport system ATP-binding protein
MSGIAIKFENISKQYRLGSIGTGTLSHDLKRWWTVSVRGKEDPYLKIGQVNDRSAKTNGEYVWALKDIDLEVKQGEVLGIIGKNGAGKSTLLKILSRVTTPTTGIIKAKGRIASLLEVGTGFHPEMTGRENIYMNGSIMGMTKSEITRKLEEIVDFAGVEKYIDTPVKRYSSGMTVRLGFAIAAHLEPEILVVDEVLAVGDAEFQKKAVGKMQDVSHNDGRTVLFVSHNMAAISVLTNRCILLNEGSIISSGITSDIIGNYIRTNDLSGERVYKIDENAPGSENVKLKAVRIISDEKVSSDVLINKEIKIEIDYYNYNKNALYDVNIHLSNAEGSYVLATVNRASTNLITDDWCNKARPIGNFRSICVIPANFLNDQQYTIDIGITNEKNLWEVNAKSVLSFNVVDNGEMRKEYVGKWVGVVRPKFEWNTYLLG